MNTEKRLALAFLCLISFADYSVGQDSITIVPGEKYRRGVIYQLFFGKHYRKIWNAPVTVEVFDPGKEMGGLVPVKQGGNFQTVNLKLKDKENREYALRSVQKYPSRALPRFLRNSMLGDLMQEQNAAENPYAALIIPYLSSHAGIYYSEPKIVYVNPDSCLSPFEKTIKSGLYLLERRPGKNEEDSDNYGNAEKIVSTPSMLEKRYGENKYKVDERLFLRSRLFDMLICDWGRHEDQWRWARYKLDNGEVLFKPIPRDRDHTFYKFDDGLIPFVANKIFLPKLQSFNSRYGNVEGLNRSAEFLDRRFLTNLSKKDWLEISDSLKNVLTDEVIDKAVQSWLPAIFEAAGEETIRKLKARRNKLRKAAEEYYKILAWSVEIVGSDQEEKFMITRMKNGSTEISVFRLNKEGEKKDEIYNRIFYKKETVVISLVGLKGDDLFEIYGDESKGIKLEIKGGEGRDVFSDYTSGERKFKNISLYDTPQEENIIVNEKSKREKINTDPAFSYYDRVGFKRKFRK